MAWGQICEKPLPKPRVAKPYESMNVLSQVLTELNDAICTAKLYIQAYQKDVLLIYMSLGT